MAERLQLSEIKNLVYQKDPNAFIAIENIHEVTSNNLKNVTTEGKGSHERAKNLLWLIVLFDSEFTEYKNKLLQTNNLLRIYR